MRLLPGLALAGAIQADLHLDTPTQMLRRGAGLDASGLESGLAPMRAGGTNLAVEVLWPPRQGDWAAQVDRLFTTVEAEDRRLDEVALVRSPAQARQEIAAGRIALLVSLEGAHGIDATGIAGLRRLHARGLSLLGLTWSFSNRFAGSSGDGGHGLSDEGRALVAEANRLGIVVDVSHASRETTLETCAVSTAPVIASHSDTAVVAPALRNLTDEEIRCIAGSGGVVGLNLHSTFLGQPASIAKVVDHAEQLRRVGGVGVVALGSDFDGLIQPPPDLPDASALPALWAAFRDRGWSDAEVDLVRGENFLRAWAATRSLAGLDP